MNIFTRMLGRVTGQPVKEVGMTVVHDGKLSMGELSALGRLTFRLLGRKIKFTSRGARRLNYISTNDLDPKSRKIYPDSHERRKREGGPRIIFDDQLVVDEDENDG